MLFLINGQWLHTLAAVRLLTVEHGWTSESAEAVLATMRRMPGMTKDG